MSTSAICPRCGLTDESLHHLLRECSASKTIWTEIKNITWWEDGCKLKLNVDGCSKGDPGQAGYGGLLRDETGIWIWGFYGKLGHCTSLEAELWAIYRGLTILFQKGTKGVEIESDSELAIDQIQNGPNTHSPYKALIEDARFLLKRCDCLLRHTLREGNRCADKLASLGVEQGEHVVLLEDPPEEVKNLVIADMTGVSVLRD
ncbi:hypothetical protein CsSME_00052119 [Camellia sinensis var. sinensis]